MEFSLSYDFKYIPVELISEVYDVFLGSDPEKKKATGSFYTPRFLAKLAVDHIWEHLNPELFDDNIPPVLDPACGSGIFLVALFHRYVAFYRYHCRSETLGWDKLVEIAESLYGLDKNPTAVLLAAFSLSIALLEQVTPPQIIKLKNEGKRLPLLLGKTICSTDFFLYSDERKFHAIIGNPPWGEVKRSINSGEQWARKNNFPCPHREMAWPFVWKATKHITDNGVIGFLLPTTSMFFNTTSKKAVRKWFNETHIMKLMNLSDMRYLLFRSVHHSAVIAVYCNKVDSTVDYSVEVLSPKADINLVSSRRVLLASQDKKDISAEELAQAPGETIKKAMWAGNRANKILDYLSTLPELSTFVTPVKQAPSKGKSRERDWLFGQGFQRATEGAGEKYKPRKLNLIDKFPLVESDEIEFLGMSIKSRKEVLPSDVLFEGFKEGFQGPRILVREGTGRRFKAVYTEQDLVYRNAVKVLSVPYAEREAGKVLTGILCSSLSSWVLLQRSQVWISRPRFQMDDLFSIPFPRPNDMPEPVKARKAWNALVDFVNIFIDCDKGPISHSQLLQKHEKPLDYSSVLSKLDDLVFDYFGLIPNERSIICDAMKHVIPSVQPNRKNLIAEHHFSDRDDWKTYCSILESELGIWLQSVTVKPSASIAGLSKDLVIVRVSLDKANAFYIETHNDLTKILNIIFEHLPDNLTRNILMLRNVLSFIDGDLYILKPRQIRFWLSESAMHDADLIASEMISLSNSCTGSI